MLRRHWTNEAHHTCTSAARAVRGVADRGEAVDNSSVRSRSEAGGIPRLAWLTVELAAFKLGIRAVCWGGAANLRHLSVVHAAPLCRGTLFSRWAQPHCPRPRMPL